MERLIISLRSTSDGRGDRELTMLLQSADSVPPPDGGAKWVLDSQSACAAKEDPEIDDQERSRSPTHRAPNKWHHVLAKSSIVRYCEFQEGCVRESH
eukprot:1260865-Amphidinium_carterae.2